MSSHTTAAFEPARSEVNAQSAWSNKDLVVHSVALFVSFTFAVYRAHLGPRTLSSLVAVAVALLCATLLPQRLPFACSSPLEIDRTVRLLRGLLLGAAIVVVSAAIFSQAGASIVRLFLCFVVVLATIRTASNVGNERAVVFEGEERAQPRRKFSAVAKRCLDIVIASLALMVLAPLCCIIAVAIKLDSPGPVLFLHQRVGYRGKLFQILKFRSMHVHSPRYQRSPSTLDDTRITRVGRVLRRLSLDETPQLVNVLRGDMSLVGPRPEMPYITRTYTAAQRRRLAVVPGITGLWQISPARAFPIHHNIEYDLYYIARQSLLLDMAILCRTASSVARGIGAA